MRLSGHPDSGVLGRTLSDMVQSVLAPHDLHAASAADMPEARALAAELIGPCIATVAVFDAVQLRTGGAAVFVQHEAGQVSGVLGVVPLTPAGLGAVLAETFNARAPDLRHVCGPHDRPAAAYGWGIAGSTKSARKAVVGGTIALHEDAFPDIPLFSRAATPEGERVILGAFGFSRMAGSTTGLMTRAPLLQEHAA